MRSDSIGTLLISAAVWSGVPYNRSLYAFRPFANNSCTASIFLLYMALYKALVAHEAWIFAPASMRIFIISM